MGLTLKQRIILIIALVITLLFGLTAGFVMGAASKDSVDWLSDLFAPKEVYQSSCTITVTNGSEGAEDVFAGNAAGAPELPQSVFQLENYYAQIDERYPNEQYQLSIEQNFNLITIKVRGGQEENLYEICNYAASLFSEKAAASTDGVSCKIVTSSSRPERIQESE